MLNVDGVAVHENRHGALVADHLGGCGKRHRRHQHRLAGLQAQGLDGEVERRGAGVDGHGVLRPDAGREARLEPLRARPVVSQPVRRQVATSSISASVIEGRKNGTFIGGFGAGLDVKVFLRRSPRVGPGRVHASAKHDQRLRDDREIQQKGASAGCTLSPGESFSGKMRVAYSCRGFFGLAENLRFAAVLDRGEVGDARPELEDPLVVLAKHFHVFGDLRSGADEAHFASEHVEQLRQFIDLRGTQHAAHAG